MSKFCIIGAGSWATALAIVLLDNNHEITLWEFRKDYCRFLQQNRKHPQILPGIIIPEKIEISNNLEFAVKNKDILIICTPSHSVQEVLKQVKKLYNNQPLICATKGLSETDALRMSEVAAKILGDEILDYYIVLSGPSHAEEVAVRIPTAVVIAGKNNSLLLDIQKKIMTNFLRIYTSNDLTGVELAGSLKNIIALASGILDGLKLGDNTKGALMTRGLAEISRLGCSMGANPLTFAGLAGIGDLITTCISKHSRNRNAGERIGRGEKLSEIIASSIMVIEGVRTTKAARILSIKADVEMPIADMMHRVLFEDLSPGKAISELMTRAAKPEWD